MAYIVGKLVWLVLRPSNLLLLTALAGAFGLGRRRAWPAALVRTGLLAMLACTLLPVGYWLTVPLENRFPRPASDLRVDGIVVLGGGVEAAVTQARGVPSFRDTLERFAAIPELARHYPEARILFTGGMAWTGAGESGLSEAAVVRRFLEQQGMPPGRVLFEDRARSTRENALFALALAEPRPEERWLLVTSAKHMPRAIGVFRAAGWPELLAWPVDYRTTGRIELGPPPYLGARLDELDEAAHEWFGLLYYRALGYTGSLWPGPRT
jgi:uncharacterized SAM-binding protein YcdF (DUF218 family)